MVIVRYQVNIVNSVFSISNLFFYPILLLLNLFIWCCRWIERKFQFGFWWVCAVRIERESNLSNCCYECEWNQRLHSQYSQSSTRYSRFIVFKRWCTMQIFWKLSSCLSNCMQATFHLSWTPEFIAKGRPG